MKCLCVSSVGLKEKGQWWSISDGKVVEGY